MKLSKVLSAIAVALVLVVSLSSFAYAASPDLITITTGSGASDIRSLGGEIIGMIQVVGSVIAVAILVILGIKYMMGSAEEKAEYKKTLIPYIIGAILIFAASNIASMVYNAISGL